MGGAAGAAVGGADVAGPAAVLAGIWLVGPVRPGRPWRRGRAGPGDPVQRVAALGQVVERHYPQPLQGAGQPAAAQRDRRRVDVRRGRQRVLDRQFAAGQERVAGLLPPGRHPLPVRAGLLLTALERLRVQPHRHRDRLAGQLVVSQAWRHGGQDLIGMGGIAVGQVPGGPPDQPGPVFVDQPGDQPGPGAGQPGFQVSGQVHRVAGPRFVR
jgi:hypothetical protein